MTPEEKAAYINNQVACMLAEMYGMIAENSLHAAINGTLLHSKEDFMALPYTYNITHADVIGYLGQ